MVTIGLILLILGIIGGAAFGIKAMSNMQSTALGKGAFQKGFGTHFQIMKFMIPCAVSSLIGIVLIIVGLFTR